MKFIQSLGKTTKDNLEEVLRQKSGEPRESNPIVFKGDDEVRNLIESNLNREDSFLGVINAHNASYLSEEIIDNVGLDLKNFYKETNKTQIFKGPVIPALNLRDKVHKFKMSEFAKLNKKDDYIRITKLFIGYFPLVSASSEMTGELSITLHDNRLNVTCIRSIKFNTTIPAVGFMNMDYCIPSKDIDNLELKVVSGFTTVRRAFDYGTIKLKAEIEFSNFPSSFNLTKTDYHVSLPIALLDGKVNMQNNANAFIGTEDLLRLRTQHLNLDTPKPSYLLKNDKFNSGDEPSRGGTNKIPKEQEVMNEINTRRNSETDSIKVIDISAEQSTINAPRPGPRNRMLAARDVNLNTRRIREDSDQVKREEMVKASETLNELGKELSSLRKDIGSLNDQKRQLMIEIES